MTDPLTKLTYQAFQQGKNYFGLAHKTLSTQLMNWVAPSSKSQVKPVSPELLRLLHQRYEAILEQDWQDAEQGVYPTRLLFDNPWEDFLIYYPMVWLDLPQIWERANQRKYQDFAPEIDTEGYPKYYVQTFHNQTDGYLSELSANLYDLQVEILFNGSADAMRRRILAPLKAGLASFQNVPAKEMRILDVACGTGRTLKMIRGMLPQAKLYGVDLSPTYLRKANQLLSEIPGELPQLLQANSEELPYLDNYFHAVTSVFLFHELPAFARQNVINECYRVIKPGGTLVICDSIQKDDSPELEVLMDNFTTMFHEPYYSHYVQDDLVARLQEAGFVNISTQVHLMSKYFVAYKPGEL